MSRVQHNKTSRRLGWATAALVLLALPAAAQAQGFFFLFGSPSPYDIERQLAAAGYRLSGPLTLRGDVYLADVVVRGEGPQRLVIDAQSGRIVERYRGRADRWREAAAPPPSVWGDDPSPWNGPRPPGAIGPGDSPPDAFTPPKPNVLEAPKEAKPKSVETKPKPTPKPTPVANVNNPPPAAVVTPPDTKSPAAPPPAVSSSPAAAPASPGTTPSAAAAPASPASPSPAIEAAKADAPSPAKPPPPPSPAPAKSKAVNDIPVTPLD